MSWLWLVLAIAVEVTATLSLRASDGMRKKLWLIPVILGYAGAFFFLSFSLQAGMPVAIAYGVWTAAGVAVVALMARILWHDPLTRRMLLGIGVIAAGVLLIEIG